MSLYITPLAKPTIRLIGEELGAYASTSFSRRVDHARHLDPISQRVIEGVSQFDQDEILTFDQNVQIIITTNETPRPTYVREPGPLGDLEFEGSITTGSRKDEINIYAETYYTLNGKDPVRTKAYLYNYMDMNDLESTGDPSAAKSDWSNISNLGFVLSVNPTGSNLITLKAITYQKGNKSRVAIAKFKIARRQNDTVINNLGTF